jgi:ppGpp synthetase/RelA/SpoT-type nucleotidyltranferase
VLTKVNILRGEFLRLHRYNPIEHVSSRVKSPESILAKVARKGITPELAAIRTIAMDFWASLEHKIFYKYEGDVRAVSTRRPGVALAA